MEPSFDIPEYPYLKREGIDNPALLVQHALERGEIKPAKPSPTIPRCPVGKKSGAATPSYHMLMQAAAGSASL